MSQISWIVASLSLLLSHNILPVAHSTRMFTLVNNCEDTVWPGIISSNGSQTFPTTGFPLTPGSSKSLTTSSSWKGRIWARTYCNSSSISFSCITGDCSSGTVECSGKGLSPPVTITEFTLGGLTGLDFYYVSLTDGYNLPVLVTPVAATGQNCNSTGCEVDVNGSCPMELQVTSSVADGGVVACKSPCEVFRTRQYCCGGAYASPEKCKPCPKAYSYAYDDATSTFTCTSGADYVITFCPSPNTPELLIRNSADVDGSSLPALLHPNSVVPLIAFPSSNTSCDPTSNFTLGSSYEKNRNILLASLVANASLSRFSALRVGEDHDSVYGLMRCRAYVSIAQCQTCVNASAEDIVRQCPSEKRASSLYHYCSLQYSDSWSFSEADDSARLTWASPNNVSDIRKFSTALGDLMSNLLQNASTSPLQIAAADAAYTNSATIHGMVQCSATLDNTNCSMCLQEIIGQIPIACPEKYGCRVVSLSCDLRYEDFPFSVNYEQWVPPPLPGTNSTNSNTTLPNKGRVSKSTIIIAASSVAGLLAIVCLLFCFFVQRRRKTEGVLDDGDKSNSAGSDRTMKPLSISFKTLRTATSHFSDENKLGQGGFGSVYKGILPDGREIAVKRLSSRSSQGIQELKAEVLLVAKLQHRNLVRLIGFCLVEEERLLVYEFLQNGSLDKVLFDEEGKRYLNWELRYRIIVGIARGLQYLHEDSQTRIIHRDLKAANVLLDQNMNPKIADFGLAKLLPGSQTQGQASRIAGTCGYMAPEYVGNGHISTKCDVYSYGVLVLEIVTGRKNSSFAEAINLPNHAWRHWTNGRALEILDPFLGEQWPMNKVLKCIQIGLLCAQESASDRPTMAEVVSMLGSDTIKNPAPKRPAFFSQATEGALVSPVTEGSGGPQSEGGNRSLAQVSITELDPR